MEARKRLYALDILRLAAAVGVFLFHGNIHMGYNYGVVTLFFSQGAVFMTAFFMLSGFVCDYQYGSRNLLQKEELWGFLKKRFLSVYPLYLGVYGIYLAVYHPLGLKKNLLIAPIELLGLQAFFPGSFFVLHNGGTWFLSCLLVAYFLFPYMAAGIRMLGVGWKWALLGILYLLCALAPWICSVFNFSDVYSNPLLRTFEFVIGCLTADVMLSRLQLRPNRAFGGLIAATILLGLGIGGFQYIGFGDYRSYQFWCIPLFAVILVCLAGADGEKLNRVLKNRIVRYCCDISFAFFLAQFFVWDISRWLFSLWAGEIGGVVKIILSFVINVALAVFLHEIVEKYIRKLLEKILGKAER